MTNFMEQIILISWQPLSYSRDSQHFMLPVVSLPRSQHPPTCRHPEADQFCPTIPIFY